jgi:hypothetical protein
MLKRDWDGGSPILSGLSVQWFSFDIHTRRKSHEFPVLDGSPSSNMNSANNCILRKVCTSVSLILVIYKVKDIYISKCCL